MEIGTGLPATHAGSTGRLLTDWARQAEQAGFSALGVLDRLAYGNYEPLVTLAAAAAVTSRIKLASTILIPGYRGGPALLAKQLATIDQLSDGRLAVGLAAGGRPDDFALAGLPYAGRGKRLEQTVARLREVWAGADGIGPAPAKTPPVYLGGHSGPALRRAAACADGWIAGASAGPAFARLAATVSAEWAALGRPGRPRLLALCYYALGPGAAPRAADYIRDYYGFSPPYASKVLASVLTEPAAISEKIAAYAAAGCDELLFYPCVPQLRQLDLLAAAL